MGYQKSTTLKTLNHWQSTGQSIPRTILKKQPFWGVSDGTTDYAFPYIVQAKGSIDGFIDYDETGEVIYKSKFIDRTYIHDLGICGQKITKLAPLELQPVTVDTGGRDRQIGGIIYPEYCKRYLIESFFISKDYENLIPDINNYKLRGDCKKNYYNAYLDYLIKYSKWSGSIGWAFSENRHALRLLCLCLNEGDYNFLTDKIIIKGKKDLNYKNIYRYAIDDNYSQFEGLILNNDNQYSSVRSEGRRSYECGLSNNYTIQPFIYGDSIMNRNDSKKGGLNESITEITNRPDGMYLFNAFYFVPRFDFEDRTISNLNIIYEPLKDGDTIIGCKIKTIYNSFDTYILRDNFLLCE